MPLSLDAVFLSTNHNTLGSSIAASLGSGWLQVSGVTASYPLYLKYSNLGVFSSVTRGFATSDAEGNMLMPFRSKDTYAWGSGGGNLEFEFVTTQGASVATFSNIMFGQNYETTNIGDWSFTQNSAKDVTAQITSYQSVASQSVFQSYEPNILEVPSFFKVWEVNMYASDGSLLATNDLTMRPDGQQPFAVFSASNVTVSGEYIFSVARKHKLVQMNGPIQHLQGTFSTTLTAPAVTSSGSSNMFSWLNNSYWYLTDLQVNLGTRAVTNRQGSIDLRPSDTINFAILFHDGTAGINPQATDIKLAVRSSNNTSPYHFWSAATVSTVTVSGDVYYAITVTASDDDLLTAQAANLLAGSNASQSLLGEIQWTTTRGTFSSDTFTINVPSEVVREPDV
jgi:hypothetical protein